MDMQTLLLTRGALTLDTTEGTAYIAFTAKLHEICSTDSHENNILLPPDVRY